MKEYRIVKETTTNTNRVTYYIERKRKFLIWEWWSKAFFYTPFDGMITPRFYSYEGAKQSLNRLTDQTIKEVVE